MPTDLSRIDHLVYATPDLEAGVNTIERLLGVRAAPGGSHPQWGTANALLSLGDSVYLEIIGPDPAQPDFLGQRVFGIDQVEGSRLTAWAARGENLDSLAGIPLVGEERIGQAFPASRQRPDGVTINWVLTDPRVRIADGLVPFFIDWLDTQHPALVTPAGAILTGFRVEHPQPVFVAQQFAALGLEVSITEANEAAIVATITGPDGEVELR
jgi:hypothetical protein